MSDHPGKVKLIRNPDRNKPPEYKPYVPQYQVHGVEPQEYHGAVVPGGAVVNRPTPLPNDNPRARRAAVQQPYAEAIVSPIGRGRGPVPNVGNNMEHEWSSDGSGIVDDLSDQADPNHPMIDNNDYVTDEALGYQNGLTAAHIQPKQKVFPPQAIEQEVEAVHQPADPNDLVPVLTGMDEDSYLLIVSGVPVCSGPKEEIEKITETMASGEHEMCDGNPVPLDDIIILKRVKVKVGLFLE